MASLHTISPITKPTIKPNTKPTTTKPSPTYLSLPTVPTTVRRRSLAVSAATTAGNDMDMVPLQTLDAGVDAGAVVGGGGSGGDGGSGGGSNGEDVNKEVVDRAINATIVLAAGSFAITKLLTIDHDYWQGWTIFEILRYAPLHNWTAYEESLKTNPVLAKMVISGVVYSVGDWIAQCYEGKPLFDFDRARMIRSGLTGFALHGSLSHYYYEFCEQLFPFHDWWVVPLKVAFDQTVWSAIWNSIYFTVLGFLRFESPVSIFKELKATFSPMLTAGWKLWPFAHLVTYGLIPVEQRLLWVDCVELIWVTILSTYSNEKSEARISEASEDATVSIPPKVRVKYCSEKTTSQNPAIAHKIFPLQEPFL